MDCFVVEKVEYIRGIPLDLLDKALEAGEVRKGSKVGLIVYPVNAPSRHLEVEVVLDNDLQANYLSRDSVLPLISKGAILRFHPRWREIIEENQSKQLRPRPGVI
ncbi:hypothetical protein ACFLRC_03305 [Candidatus Altiarchaeota archaeon]